MSTIYKIRFVFGVMAGFLVGFLLATVLLMSDRWPPAGSSLVVHSSHADLAKSSSSGSWTNKKTVTNSFVTDDPVHLVFLLVGSDLDLWGNATTCLKSVLLHRTGTLHVHFVVGGSQQLVSLVRREVLGSGPLSNIAGLEFSVIDLAEPRLKAQLEDPDRLAFWQTHFSLGHQLPADASSGGGGSAATAVANKVAKTALEQILPSTVSKVIFIDVDVLLLDDVRELWNYFSLWNADQSIGLAPELVRVYTDKVAPWAIVPMEVLRDDGFNTGVMLLHLNRLRATDFQRQSQLAVIAERERQRLPLLRISDQDLFNLHVLRHPESFFELPCSWNYQLTAVVNPWHRHCLHAPPKLLHGNFALFGHNAKFATNHGQAIYEAYSRTAWQYFVAPPKVALVTNDVDDQRSASDSAWPSGNSAASCHNDAGWDLRSHTEALADSTTQYSVIQGEHHWQYGYYLEPVAAMTLDLPSGGDGDDGSDSAWVTPDPFHRWPAWKLSFFHHGPADASLIDEWDRYEVFHAHTDNNHWFGRQCHQEHEVDACSHTLDVNAVDQVNYSRDVGARDEFWNITFLADTNRFGGLPSRLLRSVRRWTTPSFVKPRQPLLLTGRHHAQRAHDVPITCDGRFKASIFVVSGAAANAGSGSSPRSVVSSFGSRSMSFVATRDDRTTTEPTLVHRTLVYERVLFDSVTETQVGSPGAVYSVVLRNGLQQGDSLDFVLSYAASNSSNEFDMQEKGHNSVHSFPENSSLSRSSPVHSRAGSRKQVSSSVLRSSGREAHSPPTNSGTVSSSQFSIRGLSPRYPRQRHRRQPRRGRRSQHSTTNSSIPPQTSNQDSSSSHLSSFRNSHSSYGGGFQDERPLYQSDALPAVFVGAQPRSMTDYLYSNASSSIIMSSNSFLPQSILDHSHNNQPGMNRHASSDLEDAVQLARLLDLVGRSSSSSHDSPKSETTQNTRTLQ